MTPSIENLVRGLQALEDVSPTDIPTLLGELERVRTTLWLRVLSARNTPEQARPAPSADLMTVAEVARTLRFSRGHVYELIRNSDLQAIRNGRAVRVPAVTLAEWQARHRTGPVDFNSSVSLSSNHDRGRGEANPARAGAHAGLGVHKVTVAKWETDAQGMRGPAVRLIGFLGQSAKAAGSRKTKVRPRRLEGARKPQGARRKKR